MDWTKASAIAEILSSLAVLATVAYLAIEIEQNTATLEATARQASQQLRTESLSEVISTPELWLNLSNTSMTDAEKTQLSAYLISFVRGREIEWLQFQSGALDERTWTTNLGGLVDVLSYSESRKWWEFYTSTPGFVDLSFEELISGLLEDVPVQTRLTDLQAFD